MDVYEKLSNAIILQAVKDYRDALKKLKKRPDSITAQSVKQEAERFFRSDWYAILTDVDGEMLMKRLREQAGCL